MAELADYISPEDVQMLQQLIGATTTPDVYQAVDPAEFEEQASKEVAPFYDKNLDLVRKQINQAKEHMKEQKELAERQEEESFGAFQNVQDRNFARILSNQQSGFAGRGTYTSGFRRGEVEQTRQGQEDVMSEAERGIEQAGEKRDLRFTQFLGQRDLEQELEELNIGRQREQERMQRQQQLAQQAQAQTAQKASQSARDFSRSFGSFIQDNLAA